MLFVIIVAIAADYADNDDGRFGSLLPAMMMMAIVSGAIVVFGFYI